MDAFYVCMQGIEESLRDWRFNVRARDLSDIE